jgi:hypothetical protein
MTKLVHGQVLTARCRCGGEVIRDDDARTVLHSDPVCDWFEKLASSGNPEVREIKTEAVDAHLAALRQRVRNQKDPS